MATIEERYLKDIAHIKDFLKAPDGDLQTITGVENAKQALIRRLVTQPGSLVHRPEYGVGLKDFQNAVNSLENQRRLAQRIREQFERDFRVEEFVGMKFTQDSVDPAKLTVFFKVKLQGFGEVTVEFQPFGEAV